MQTQRNCILSRGIMVQSLGVNQSWLYHLYVLVSPAGVVTLDMLVPPFTVVLPSNSGSNVVSV